MSGWLKDVLVEARVRGWCTKPYCTTCGSQEFQSAVRNGAIAAAQAVRRGGADTSLPPEEFAALREESALVEELRSLGAVEVAANTDAIRTILLSGGVSFLRESLQGCAVGDALDAMAAHSKERADARSKQAELERGAPQRKAARLAANAAKHQARLAEKKLRDALRESDAQ